MLTWNTRDITAEALRALRGSDQGVPYRLFLRDNGSADGTAQAARAAYPEAEIDAAADNVGFAAGMNSLIARTTAPYVFLLNGDAWPEPGTLARLVAAAEANPTLGLVVPRLVRPDGELEHSTWPFPSLRLSALYASGLRALVPHRLAERWMFEKDWAHDRSRLVSWAVGAAWLIPRRVLDVVGGLDERYFMYGEDVDWCWRVTDAGFRIWFEADAVVRHVGGASSEVRYDGGALARKLAASTRVMVDRRGRLYAGVWRWLEIATAARIALLARLRGNAGAAAWARSVIRTHRAPPPPEQR
jgi:GT2 family glycosyltransferase